MQPIDVVRTGMLGQIVVGSMLCNWEGQQEGMGRRLVDARHVRTFNIRSHLMMHYKTNTAMVHSIWMIVCHAVIKLNLHDIITKEQLHSLFFDESLKFGDREIPRDRRYARNMWFDGTSACIA